jgi:hypothetical protein
MVPATVLAETCYLIDRALGPAAEAAFLDSVGTGPDYTFQLVELVDSDLRRMSGLVRQYAGLRLGGTGASVAAVCERVGIVTVATVNLRTSPLSGRATSSRSSPSRDPANLSGPIRHARDIRSQATMQ